MRIDAALAEGELVAVDDRQRARCVRADRAGVGAMHDDLRVGKRARDVCCGIAVVGVLVRDEDIAQVVRAIVDRAQQGAGESGRIDQRRRPSVVKEKEVAVRGVRRVGVMAHVVRNRRLGRPPLGRSIGELAGIQAEQRRERARLVLAGNAVAARPAGDRVRSEPAAPRERIRVESRAAHRFAENVPRIVLEGDARPRHPRCLGALRCALPPGANRTQPPPG
jgi:hypothetical protein